MNINYTFSQQVGEHNLMKEDADEQMLEIEKWEVHPNFGKGELWDVWPKRMQ